MANTNAPRGLIPIAGAYSQPYSAGVRLYYHDSGDSNAIGIGDLVTATGSSTFYNMGGIVQSIPNVQRGATGDVFQGVCIGVLQTTRDSTIYAPASTGIAVFVCDDPNALFWVQDGNSGTPLTANDIGLNVNVTVGTVNTTTGFSGLTLDNTSEATTNTLDLKIIGQYQSVDNDLGSAVGTGALAGKWIVRINRHRFANQIAGI